MDGGSSLASDHGSLECFSLHGKIPIRFLRTAKDTRSSQRCSSSLVKKMLCLQANEDNFSSSSLQIQCIFVSYGYSGIELRGEERNHTFIYPQQELCKVIIQRMSCQGSCMGRVFVLLVIQTLNRISFSSHRSEIGTFLQVYSFQFVCFQCCYVILSQHKILVRSF